MIKIENVVTLISYAYAGTSGPNVSIRSQLTSTDANTLAAGTFLKE